MSSFLTQNSSQQSSYIAESSVSGSFLTNKVTCSSNDTPEQPKSNEQYQQYVKRKRQQIPQTQSNNQVRTIRKIIYASLIAFFIFVIFFHLIQKEGKPQQGSQNPSSKFFPNHRPQAHPKPIGSCNSFLPYSISIQKQLQKSYYLWYGKVGANIKGMSYETGHFIERHVAANGQCKYSQQAEGKTVFYDWNQVTKAFRIMSNHKCPLSDLNTFSYDFEIKIPSPSKYIKGIDCRTGIIQKFSKIFILYRKATKNPRPYQDQYLASNHLTIWTFYPKN